MENPLKASNAKELSHVPVKHKLMIMPQLLQVKPGETGGRNKALKAGTGLELE